MANVLVQVYLKYCLGPTYIKELLIKELFILHRKS